MNIGKNLRLANYKRNYDDNFKNTMSKAMKGKLKSEDHKKKLSEAAKRRKTYI